MVSSFVMFLCDEYGLESDPFLCLTPDQLLCRLKTASMQQNIKKLDARTAQYSKRYILNNQVVTTNRPQFSLK